MFLAPSRAPGKVSGIEDNFEVISLFVHKNIHCDPSLEPPRLGGSNEGSQCMFILRNKKIISELSSKLSLI